MSVNVGHRPNTAAVVRDRINHVFTAGLLTSGDHGIIQTTFRDDTDRGTQEIMKLGGDLLRTIENTPLAATVVWDNTQINLYYFQPSTSGAFLREICRKDDNDWGEGSLSQFLVERGVFPNVNSTITVWNDNEVINVYFKSSDDGPGAITLATYDPIRSQWHLTHKKF